MKKTHRLVLLSTTLLGALALAAPALAGYTPRLSVFSTGQSPGSAGVKVKYSQASNDDAVQRLSVFVPKGYTLSGGGAVGTRIGSATLSVVAGDIHKAVKTTGPLVVASASDFQTEAQAWTSGATHAAVWSVTVAVSGTAFRIPIYVDTSVTGAAAPNASGELTICFAAPDLPPGTPGRAALGAKIVNFALTTTAITAPKETGIYRWRAAAIPFTPGTNLSNAKGIVEVQSLVGLPLELTLNAKIAAANGGSSRVDLTGAFKAAGSSI